MKLQPVLLLTLLLSAGVGYSAEEHLATLKVGSEVYTNVTITAVTPTDIYFSHSRGVGNAKLKKLDPELQKKFHFDPTKAAEKEKQQADDKSRYFQAVSQVKPEASPQPPQQPQPEPSQKQSGRSGSSGDIVPAHEIHARSFLHRPAPEIIVEKWLSGPPDMAGKFVLVDFWATWCGPCRQSIPEINKLYSKFKDRLVVIGLSNEPEMTVKRMTSPKIDYYVAIDTKSQSKNTIGVTGIPHAILIDPKGVVRFEGHPAYLDENNLGQLIAKYTD